MWVEKRNTIAMTLTNAIAATTTTTKMITSTSTKSKSDSAGKRVSEKAIVEVIDGGDEIASVLPHTLSAN